MFNSGNVEFEKYSGKVESDQFRTCFRAVFSCFCEHDVAVEDNSRRFKCGEQDNFSLLKGEGRIKNEQ
jgi:hypothetical protein